MRPLGRFRSVLRRAFHEVFRYGRAQAAGQIFAGTGLHFAGGCDIMQASSAAQIKNLYSQALNAVRPGLLPPMNTGSKVFERYP